MTGEAIICRLENIEPIEGADRIVQCTMFGETVIVPKDCKEGQLGLLFDIETQLSHEYCHHNNLYKDSNLNADSSKTGYIEKNRRVRPIRLKGVRTSGLWMPIESIEWTMNATSSSFIYPETGTQLTEWNNKPICKKYMPPPRSLKKFEKKTNEEVIPTFKEHFDTDHFARNSHKIDPNDLVIVTEKLHGTSGRCGYLPIIPEKWYDKYLNKIGLSRTPEYKFVVGSRRVVKSVNGEEAGNNNHHYETDLWTKVSKEFFEGKLNKGETVYFEIVGYTPEGRSIMPVHNTSDLKPYMDKKEYKDYVDRYGEKIVYNYRCGRSANEEIWKEGSPFSLYDVFVYRITLTTETGESIDYSWEQVKNRCEELGVSYVPELAKIIISKEVIEDGTFEHYIEEITNSPSFNFPQHPKEGVCIRAEKGGMQPLILKHKGYYFRIMEGHKVEMDMEDEN